MPRSSSIREPCSFTTTPGSIVKRPLARARGVPVSKANLTATPDSVAGCDSVTVLAAASMPAIVVPAARPGATTGMPGSSPATLASPLTTTLPAVTVPTCSMNV